MTQPDLFDAYATATRHGQAFARWVHTPAGGQAANLFIRLAIGCHRRGVRMGAKAIWERLRWHYGVRRADGEEWRLNNNYHSHMARFAMERAGELAGYFETRQGGKRTGRRVIVIEERRAGN